MCFSTSLNRSGKRRWWRKSSWRAVFGPSNGRDPVQQDHEARAMGVPLFLRRNHRVNTRCCCLSAFDIGDAFTHSLQFVCQLFPRFLTCPHFLLHLYFAQVGRFKFLHALLELVSEPLEAFAL